MKSVRKAVIPAGGFGTRMLPATKAVPKEMLTIVDKPLIQYCVEEAVSAGCDQILIITSRGKVAIEDHFDASPDLERTLTLRNKTALLNCVNAVSTLARISFVRQAEALGLGNAVMMARDFVGDEPFALLLPDDMIHSSTPGIKQLVDTFSQVGHSVLGSVVVEGVAIENYGCLKPTNSPNDRLFTLSDVVEKPTLLEAPSNHSVVGRYVLTAGIFEYLKTLAPGSGGELQLTDAIRQLIHAEPVYGYTLEGIRYDVGDRAGFIQANLEYALRRSDIGPALREWLATYTNVGEPRVG